MKKSYLPFRCDCDPACTVGRALPSALEHLAHVVAELLESASRADRARFFTELGGMYCLRCGSDFGWECHCERDE